MKAQNDLLEAIVGKTIQVGESVPFTVKRAKDEPTVYGLGVVGHTVILIDENYNRHFMNYEDLDTLLREGVVKIPEDGMDCYGIRLVEEEATSKSEQVRQVLDRTVKDITLLKELLPELSSIIEQRSEDWLVGLHAIESFCKAEDNGDHDAI